MNFCKKYGYYFLLLGIMSDFLTPYILGIFYPGMNQMTMVMSVSGDINSPVREAFLIISLITGCFFVFALPAIYQTFSQNSRILTVLLVSSLGSYGIADCIFTGLFSINTNQVVWGISTWIHNIGSAVGYLGFLLFPFFLFLLYFKREGKIHKYSRLYLITWFISLFFAGIYGLARIPLINHWPVINQIGLCQRVSFFFNYLPMFVFTIDQINIKNFDRL